jgi:hypothetical protein
VGLAFGITCWADPQASTGCQHRMPGRAIQHPDASLGQQAPGCRARQTSTGC